MGHGFTHLSTLPCCAAVTAVCYTPFPMPDLLAALDAFVQEHRRCGDLDGGVEGERAWMACDGGAIIAHRRPPAGPDR
jgi:hypothetical protein